MKGDVLNFILKKRYIDVESNSVLVLATLLRDKFFSGQQK